MMDDGEASEVSDAEEAASERETASQEDVTVERSKSASGVSGSHGNTGPEDSGGSPETRVPEKEDVRVAGENPDELSSTEKA